MGGLSQEWGEFGECSMFIDVAVGSDQGFSMLLKLDRAEGGIEPPTLRLPDGCSNH